MTDLDQFKIDQEKEQSVQELTDLLDIFGLLETVDSYPTITPRRFYDQIKIMVSGGNASLYVYDVTNAKWRAATLGT